MNPLKLVTTPLPSPAMLARGILDGLLAQYVALSGQFGRPEAFRDTLVNVATSDVLVFLDDPCRMLVERAVADILSDKKRRLDTTRIMAVARLELAADAYESLQEFYAEASRTTEPEAPEKLARHIAEAVNIIVDDAIGEVSEFSLIDATEPVGAPNVPSNVAPEIIEAPESAPAAPTSAEPIPKAPEPGQQEFILDRGAPLQTARTFLESKYTVDGVRALHYQGGAFHPYDGTCYPEMNEDAIRSEIYLFLEPAWVRTKEAGLIEFRPNRATVGETVDALKAISILSHAITPPAWLEGEGPAPAAEFIVCRNGLLHLPTGKLYPHTPRLYAMNALSFDFDPHAPVPAEWNKFLDSIFDDDTELRDTLQMMIGYFLTTDTRQQKIFLIVGPRRGGKGTIARMIAHLVGKDNIAAPTLALLGQHFGLTHLIGKQVAIISDARLGKHTDQSTIAERLLSISGEDNLTIPRKYEPDWTGRLYARPLIMTNELPRITDSSGALPSRFIVFNLTESFLGREDHDLEHKLIQELPGILNWAIEGWRMLQEVGRFTQPASARDAVQELEDLSSPIGAFTRDECVVEPGAQVLIAELFSAWKVWAMKHGWEHTGTVQSFGRDLRAARQGIKSTQRRAEGDPKRYYTGIRLKKEWEV